MVKLRVTVGGSYTDLAIVNCNDELHPIEFDAPNFKGRAMVRIKDFGKLPLPVSLFFFGGIMWSPVDSSEQGPRMRTKWERISLDLHGELLEQRQGQGQGLKDEIERRRRKGGLLGLVGRDILAICPWLLEGGTISPRFAPPQSRMTQSRTTWLVVFWDSDGPGPCFPCSFLTHGCV